MTRSLLATGTLALSLIALAPLAAAHGGEYTAEGLADGSLRFTLLREPDADPNAVVPPGMFATIFTVTIADATGAVLEQATFAGFDSFDGHGTTVPAAYTAGVRDEAGSGIHFHGSGEAARANLFVIEGHFEGPVAVHHDFAAVAVAL